MPITIKHGAKLEGRGMAYGAASKAAYVRQLREEEKKEKRKAKRLGNIGSVLSTAGAVASFIPGLQPVGMGLSIAGGALGRVSGGQGDPTGQAVAMGAQGISQIYQAQASKVEAQQQEWENWKQRADYTQELSSLSKAQNLAQQVKVRDDEFIQLTRGQNRKYMDQKNAVLEAVNLGAFKAYDLDTLEEASMSTGQYGNALKQVIPKLKELQQEHRATLKQIDDARQNDPTMTVERLLKQQVEEVENQKKQLAQEQKALKEKAKKEEDLAKEHTRTIRTSTNIIADIEAELSVPEKFSSEAYQAKINQRNFEMGELSKALTGRVETVKTLLANEDQATMQLGEDLWISRRVEELVAQHRAGIGRDLSEELWSRNLGKIMHDYKRLAYAELEEMVEESPLHLQEELAKMIVTLQSGLNNADR